MPAPVGKGGALAAALDDNQRVLVPDAQSHHPWLVPGIGKL
jgi:hypothetical protein